jgi:hypothetical protein
MNQPPDGEEFRRNVEPPQTPFGEDITNPDSGTMPQEFHGEWVRDPDDCHAMMSSTRIIIGRDRIVIGGDAQRVVAVRFIDTRQVAVVTLPAEMGQKEYSLFYFGVSEDGTSLLDLESMDWVLQRCSTGAD